MAEGGSSGGSAAAVAARMVPMATAADGGTCIIGIYTFEMMHAQIDMQ